MDEYNLFENQLNDNLEKSSPTPIDNVDISPRDTSSDNDTDQSVLNKTNTLKNENETEIEDVQPIRHRTIEEIMAESDISFHNSSDDQIGSQHKSQSSTKTSMKDINPSFEINHPSILSISDDEISIEQFENELADVQNKSKDIEDMIENFLLKK
jgi:hypothetical protein